MQRITDASADATLPAPPALAGAIMGYFSEGNPGVQAATLVRAWWLNMVQEELMSILAAGGIAPDTTATNFAQVLQAIRALIRTRLTGNLNLYVSPSGSDSNNNGLSSTTPFQTIQHAFNVLAASYDLAGNTVFINLANGSYAPATFAEVPIGGGLVEIIGTNGASNVTINAVNASSLTVGASVDVSINGVTLQATGSGGGQGCGRYCSAPGSNILLAPASPVAFGACSVAHMCAQSASSIVLQGNYTITGSAVAHMLATSIGEITASSQTLVTLSGTPAFSGAFAEASNCGVISLSSSLVGFSGSATGVRYAASLNGVINTNAAGASYFPGSAAGFLSTGGQYN